MDEIMRELYYMINDWADQQFRDDQEAKSLKERKLALEDEMALRLGDDGQELIEALADLNLRLEDIHGQALFRAAVSLGTEAAQSGRGAWAASEAVS